MGWETRGSNRYYTRSRREGGRVVREYVGNGLLAQAEAHFDARDRQEREDARRAERQRQDALNAQDAAVAAFCSSVEAFLRAVLIQAGYHRHARGEWRKKREVKNMTDVQDKAVTKQERRDKVQKGFNGTKAEQDKALAEVKAHPHEICLHWANPKDALLNLVGMPSSSVVQEVIGQEYAAMVAEYAGPDPMPLERLLAERIAVCRMQITHYERTYAAKLRNSDGVSFKYSANHEQRMDSLHRRYLSAIKALAQVRRLQLPAVQVNIGGQQVNLAGEAVNGAVRGLREARAAAENGPM